jgi:hypothetical protein
MAESSGSDSFPVPVLLMVFNRPAATRRVFKRIAEVRPAKLLIVADGPRPDRPGEEELCREVKEIVSALDWPCEILTNFASSNLGCCQRIVTGLDWAFSIVEQAVILEDDCLADLSFFPFCQQLLEKYRVDNRIASISGTNLVEKHVNTPYDYYFSRLGGIWGWATWRTRWQEYDRYLENWPALRRSGVLSEIFDQPKHIAYWTRIFDAMFEGLGPSTWDYQWVYTNLFAHKLTIVPRVNLVRNIGFNAGATHSSNASPRFTPKVKTIDFPLKHPATIAPSRNLDDHFQELYFPSVRQRITLRMRRLIGG